MLADAVIGSWVGLVLALGGLGLHRLLLAVEALRAVPPVARRTDQPSVTVQLPLFNEATVAADVVRCAGALRWPRDRFEVQVLDDSTDDTRAIVDEAVAALRAEGIDACVLRRPARTGFKAGALAAGLVAAKGEVLAILDADFRPQPDWLEQVVPALTPGVACVQARWGHLNVGATWLTRAQATMLDAHFVLEHRGRARAGCWFNFNGTAGVWRKEAITASGGWRADTLVEDLDLSYRAWLSGWRLVYLDEVVVPAELPQRMSAFRSQQRRWAKGGVQAARRLLPKVLRAPVRLRVRAEAVAHLMGNAGYVMSLMLAVVSPLVPWLRPASAWTDAPGLWVGLGAVGLAPLVLSYGLAVVLARSGATGRRLVELPVALCLGAGLCLAQTRAVLEGLGREVGTFERTPKEGRGLRARYVAAGASGGAGELGLAAWQGVGLWGAVHEGSLLAVVFLGVLAGGLLLVGLSTRWERARDAALDHAPVRG